MTFIALRGNRESISQSSENYKEKIIEYMNARGYILTHDSSTDGILPDLIFYRPYIEGKKETWVESKFKDLSLKDIEFLSELGRYFNAYIRRTELQRFKLFIFIRKCSAQNNWKNIFEETKGYQEDVKILKQSIEGSLGVNDLETFNKSNFDDFSFFINDITIIEGNYEDIHRNAEHLVNTDKFNVEKSLLEDISNIENVPEILIGNFLKVNTFPQELWIAEAKENFDMKKFWDDNKEEIAHFYNKKIYSLNPILSEERFLNYLKENTVTKIMLKTWTDDEETKTNILKSLIKKYIIYKGKEIGLWYDRELDCLFFPNKRQQDEFKIKSRVVSRIYRSLNGQINYVKHDGITVDVNHIGTDFYVIFNLIILFTTDGKEIIRGESAKTLHYYFTKEYAYNDTEKSKLLHWINIFQFKNRTFGNQEYFLFSDQVTVSCPVSYKGGEIFDITLLDFINEGL